MLDCHLEEAHRTYPIVHCLDIWSCHGLPQALHRHTHRWRRHDMGRQSIPSCPVRPLLHKPHLPPIMFHPIRQSPPHMQLTRLLTPGPPGIRSPHHRPIRL